LVSQSSTITMMHDPINIRLFEGVEQNSKRERERENFI